MFGRTMACKLMAHALIDFAAYRRREVFEGGHKVVLEPGDAMFSRPDLARLIGCTEKQVRGAETALVEAGFCTFRQVARGAKGFGIYSVNEWQRFIAEADSRPEHSTGRKRADSGQIAGADEQGNDGFSRLPLGQIKGRLRADSPSRVSRANVQNSEHRTTEQVRAGASGDPVRTTARVVGGQPHPHVIPSDPSDLEADKEWMAFLRMSEDEQNEVMRSRNGGSHA